MKAKFSGAFLGSLAALLGLALAALAGAGARRAPGSAPADLVLTNGDLFTVDPARPEVQALAVRGGQILAVGSIAELQQRIRQALPKYAPGEWILGHGWDQTLWPGKETYPTRQDLDAVTRA